MKRDPGLPRCGGVAVWLGFWHLSTALMLGAAEVEFLSERPELVLSHSQAWGVLGLNTAAHAPDRAGEPLRIGTQTYTNGLGHHAHGRLVVWLGGEFATFEAEVGLQPCGGGGTVIFRVLADGQTLFDSGVMRASDPARPVRVSVAGAQELVLEATDAGDGITCDMANWANARLVRAAGAPRAGFDSVDVARFATVITSDPSRLDGARASRVEEFRAEDLFLTPELGANPDGSYTVTPNAQGLGCIGLKWLSQRPLRELRLRLAPGSVSILPKAVQVQGWFGESAWQGNWLPLDGAKSLESDEVVMRLSAKAPRGGLLQTRMIRWLLPTGGKPIIVRELKAFTRSRWAQAEVQVEAENPPAGARGQVRVFNGELVSSDGPAPVSATGWREWDLARPLRLRLRYCRSFALKGDATVLQFRMPAGDVGVGLEDLLTHRSVYVPSRGLYAVLADGQTAPPSLAEYKRSVAGRRTILEEVRALPDQTLAQALAKTHRAAQNEGPVMLSLACHNTKFVVDRDGDVHFPALPPTNDNWFAFAAVLDVTFADGQQDRFQRRLEGGWLPMPLLTIERAGIRYSERAFVAPDDEDGPNPARLNRRAVCVVEFSAENLREQPQLARIELRLKPPGPKPAPVELARIGPTDYSARVGRMQVWVVADQAALPERQSQAGTLTWAGELPGRSSRRWVVFLGEPAGPAHQAGDVGRLRAGVEAYWRAVLAAATQIETPDALLNDVVRSSQVRCLIAARNEAGGARVAPWIAAMAYGPLESEAHSVIRGMDFLGHHDFARRSLEYFIHRYHPNGFLTTGYTTFGTAWHLWTLAEHCELTGEQAWLRQHADQLRRVGDWILRQMAKTRRTGPDGEPVPESGLMPPAVMADWNAFAYHFMLNGYYYAALRGLGRALAGLGDPQAAAYQRGAEELRQAILRACRWTQGQAPALPLRNGTWVPLYPSQVHSPGRLADFFPGADAGRSWAYDVELGAHQLVPTGVLAPDDPEVTQMLEHMEDEQFLGEGWFDYPTADNARDWFNLGGFAKVQPYYCRAAEIYALRDEVKPFLRTYFNSLASLLNTEVLTLWEHFHHSGAWDKTHETGYFLHQTRIMLVQERGAELWLAPLIPAEWLRPGRTLVVSNAPTRFGPVSFRLNADPAGAQVQVELQPPRRNPPQTIVLRLRHPDGRRLRAVQVQGRPHERWQAESNCVFLAPTPEPVRVVAEF